MKKSVWLLLLLGLANLGWAQSQKEVITKTAKPLINPVASLNHHSEDTRGVTSKNDIDRTTNCLRLNLSGYSR